jgi:hypothetical protein
MRDNKKPQGTEKKLPPTERVKTTRVYIKILIILSAIIIAASVCIAGIVFRSGKCRLTYLVRPLSAEDMTLSVEADISGAKALGKTVYMSALNTGAFDIEVIDDGSSIPYVYKNGTLSFVPASQSVGVRYTVRLGIDGKHGKNGIYLDDLIVFCGEQVFILPEQFVDGTDEQISKLVSRISVDFELPCGSQAVPFERNGSTRIDNPDWASIYDFSKNAYAFGDFTKQSYEQNNKQSDAGAQASGYNVFFEGESPLDEAVSQKISALFCAYSRLYEGAPQNLNIILLRNNAGDILGGAGAQTICSSFEPGLTRDWQLLSHRIGHAFFESAAGIREFHDMPMLWFFEGLITYYENKTMDDIGIGYSSSDGFSEIAGRYYYMRIKDPLLLSVVPMNEKNITLIGQLEFLHYTYAPLIYKYLEDNLQSQDGILKFILANRDNPNMDMRFILSGLFDTNDSIIKNCIYGDRILPIGFANTITDKRMLDGLREYEKLLWTWFSTEFEDYPLDEIQADSISGDSIPIDSISFEDIVSEAELRGVAFADDAVMRDVKDFSDIVYGLLIEYALRAEVCGVSYDSINLRYELLGDSENVRMWKDFLKQLAS